MQLIYTVQGHSKVLCAVASFRLVNSKQEVFQMSLKVSIERNGSLG